MILYRTKFLTLKAAKRENKPDWVYAVRENARMVAVILPVLKKENDEDEILFLITKRPPLLEEKIAEYSIETPAGLVGDENPNETLEEALAKELLEETGLVAENFEICNGRVSTSGGMTSEFSTIAIANIKNSVLKTCPIDDGGVIIDRIWVKKSNIKNFLKEKEQNGFAIGAQALAALFYL